MFDKISQLKLVSGLSKGKKHKFKPIDPNDTDSIDVRLEIKPPHILDI